MQMLAVVALALIGTGLVLSVLGTLRGTLALSPVTAYSGGQRPDASARAAAADPARVRWTRALLVGVACLVVGVVLVNFV